jgi:hypothetical protein
MLVGYMRVSTEDDRQVMDLQRDALLAAGVDERHLFEDRASGKRGDRAGLAKALTVVSRWGNERPSRSNFQTIRQNTAWRLPGAARARCRSRPWWCPSARSMTGRRRRGS